MPAIYAHNRFGEAVIATLPPSFRDFLKKYNEAFCLGTQGPDILFYHRPIKSNPTRKKGMDMHLTPAEGFFLKQGERLFKDKLVKEQNGVYLPASADAAYIAGFICHFTLDVFAHPHIYELEDTGVSHGRIESEFDKYLLRKDGRPIRGFKTAGQITKKNGTAQACANALEVSTDEILRSIKTMRTINNDLFSNPFPPVHGFCHFVLRIAGMEGKFGEMFLHKKDDPACNALNSTLEKDLSDAVPKAAALIEDYFSNLPKHIENGKLDEFFGNNYTGGKFDGKHDPKKR